MIPARQGAEGRLVISSDSYRSDIQGMRAVALALVIAYHTDLLLEGGYIGVDVFFVVSGYVIVGSLLRNWSKGKFNPLDFYLRRAKRLLPAFGVMAVSTMLLSVLFTTYEARNQGYDTGAAGALSFANLQLMLFRPNVYFTSSEQANPFLHVWLLSVEEQIYLVIPLILAVPWLIGWKRDRLRRILASVVFVAVGAISLLACYSFTFSRTRWPFDDPDLFSRGLEASRMIAFYSPFTRIWEFLAGGLIAVTGLRLTTNFGRILTLAGLGLIGFAVATFSSSTSFPGTAALLPVAGSSLMLIGSDSSLGRVKLLGNRVFAWIGDRSYSIYLWHWPLILFAKATFPNVRHVAVVGLLLSLAPALLTYRYVEEPVRRSTRIGDSRWLTSVVAIVSTAPVVLLGAGFRVEPTPELQVHEDVLTKCVEKPFDVILSADQCIWPLEGATRDALLVGDSQAGHVTEAFIDAAHRIGLNARVATRTGPFMTHPDRDYVANLIGRSQTIDVVVVGQLTFEGDLFQQWEPLILGFLGKITESGKKVVFLHRIQKGGEPLRCATIRLMLDEHACELPANESLASHEYVRNLRIAESTALANLAGVSGFDPNPYLCRAYPCPSQQEEGWLWRDPSHLSRRSAERLTEPLAQSMSKALRS